MTEGALPTTGTYRFIPLDAVRFCPPLDDMRWFHCRFSRTTYVGAPVGQQPVEEQRLAHIAHEALCLSRPPNLERTVEEHAAVEAWHGPAIRDRIHRLAGLESEALTQLRDPGVRIDRQRNDYWLERLADHRKQRAALLDLLKWLNLPVLPPGVPHAH